MTGNGECARRQNDACSMLHEILVRPVIVPALFRLIKLSYILSVDLQVDMCMILTVIMRDQRRLSCCLQICWVPTQTSGPRTAEKECRTEARSQTCPGPEQSNCVYHHFFHKQAATPARLLAHHDNLRCLRVRSVPTETLALKTKKVPPQSRVKFSKTLELRTAPCQIHKILSVCPTTALAALELSTAFLPRTNRPLCATPHLDLNLFSLHLSHGIQVN